MCDHLCFPVSCLLAAFSLALLLNLNYDPVIPTTKSQIIISGLRLTQYFASIREFVTFNLKPNFSILNLL